MKNKGFTIIELVIAIFILSVAVIGIYNSFSTMVVLTSGAADRLTAAYLAQEGMEIVRNIRDTNWINGNSWYDGLSGCDNGCMGDYKITGAVDSQLSPYVDSEYLKIDTDGFYSQTSGAETRFRRKITITFIDGGELPSYIANVSVQVFWNQKPTILNPDGLPGVIETEENLYDWY